MTIQTTKTKTLTETVKIQWNQLQYKLTTNKGTRWNRSNSQV